MAPAFARAFAKSQIGGGTTLPTSGCAFISVKDEDKPFIVDAARTLLAEGFSLMATGGTHSYLVEQGLEVKLVKKVLEGRPHIVDAMKNGEVQLVFNTTSQAVAAGQLLPAPHRPDDEDALLHHHRRALWRRPRPSAPSRPAIWT